MMNLNERAWQAAMEAAGKADELGIRSTRADCGTTILDCGVHAPGGLAAGLLMAEIGMAKLGTAWLEKGDLAGMPWTWICTHSDHPAQACFRSQAAHWAVALGDFHAMGSGPACLLNKDLPVGNEPMNAEVHGHAVLVLEASSLPGDGACRSLSASCRVKPVDLAVLVAPTASLAGSAQIAARSLETGLHKLHHLGFDLQRVASGTGHCPLAVPASDDLVALGRTNDMVLFGSSVCLFIKGTGDDELARLASVLPSGTSPSYGKPFLQALKEAGGFYQLDPGLFAPAEATLVNLESGNIFHGGAVDEIRLAQAVKGTGNG